MPAVFLDRLPLPSLQAYTTISVLLLTCSIYYAIRITSTSEWESNFHFGISDVTESSNVTVEHEAAFEEFLLEHPIVLAILDVVYFMIQEPMCIWTLINMAYCCLILVGRVIQQLVFGELRVSEQQHIKDKFWNFVFYKFIFIFGVMNVQYMEEVVLWCSWFSILGFLHLLAQLCKDRFEYLSFSPTTPKWTHIRLLSLLSCIWAMSSSLLVLCVFVGINAGINTFAFMLAECALVSVRTSYVIARYAIHLWDISREGVWERRATYVYYTELLFELTALGSDFFHHLHMLLWGNIFLSMASLVICMQLRYLFYEIQRRIKKHKNYLRVVKHMEANYPMATTDELEKNRDDCAICWDRMDTARRLPCSHFFHNTCLRSWLEQDTSCPTCRMPLSDGPEVPPANIHDILAGDEPRNRPVNQTTNHFFHFDGSRYVSWFPSFSVEVTHTNILGERHIPVQTSQLDTMSRQVHQLFPNIPVGRIMDDLRATRSLELTVENILDERLVPPPSSLFHGNRASPPRELQANDSTGIDPSRSLDCELQSTGNDAEVLSNEGPSDAELVDASKSACNGSRFSKSPREREYMLARRKEDLMKLARRKYLSKIEGDTSDEGSAPENVRLLAYEAAQRRMEREVDL